MVLTTADGADGEIVTKLTGGVGVPPVPTSCNTTGVELALVMMERLPLTLPDEVALNITVKAWLWPGASAMGVVKPAMLKPVPVTLV